MAPPARGKARLKLLRDSDVVSVQLGRPARGEVTVASRCRFGLPLVVRTPPALEDGSPFPTLYYLTCPLAVRNAGALESAGVMKELSERLASDAELATSYRRAHERYIADRGGGDPSVSAGGMPGRVKCLHALYAHEVADANPIGALVRDRIDPIDCPGPCVTDEARTPGHPGYAKPRRR